MDHTLGGGSFFGFGAGCVTPGSESGFWAGASGAAFAFSFVLQISQQGQ